MSLEQKYDLIEQYLSGKLAGNALRTFEQKIESDPDLAAEVNLHRQVADAISDDAFWSFEQMVKEVGYELERSTPVISEDELPTIDLADYIPERQLQANRFEQQESQAKVKKLRTTPSTSTKVLRFYKRMLAAAAAVIVLLTAGLLFTLLNAPQQTASNTNQSNSQTTKDLVNPPTAQVNPVIREKGQKGKEKTAKSTHNKSNRTSPNHENEAFANASNRNIKSASENYEEISFNDLNKLQAILQKKGFADAYKDQLPEYGLLDSNSKTSNPNNTTTIKPNTPVNKHQSYNQAPVIELNKHNLATAQFVLEGKYDTIYDFYNNIAKVRKNGKFGYIKYVFEDKKSDIFESIVPPIYEEANDFKGGMAEVKKDGVWRMINTAGKEILK